MLLTKHLFLQCIIDVEYQDGNKLNTEKGIF